MSREIVNCKVRVCIFLHSHYKTKKLLSIDICYIDKIYQGRFYQEFFELIEKEFKETLNEFKHLKTENAYVVDVEINNNDDVDEPEEYVKFDNVRLDNE